MTRVPSASSVVHRGRPPTKRRVGEPLAQQALGRQRATAMLEASQPETSSESTSRRRCGPCSVILILIFASSGPISPRQQHQTRTGLPPLSQPVRAAGVTPSPTMAVQRIQQGRRHRSCCSTREDRTPSHAPGLLCPQPPPWTFTSNTCSGKLARDYRPLTFSPRAPGTHSRKHKHASPLSAAHSCRTANSSDLKRLHTDVEEIECWAGCEVDVLSPSPAGVASVRVQAARRTHLEDIYEYTVGTVAPLSARGVDTVN